MNVRNFLLNAIEELVNEKPFDSITVQDILDRADIARSTFYRYYDDKYNLANAYYQNYVESKILPKYNGKNWYEILLEIAQFVKSNKNYFSKIISRTDTNSFDNFLCLFGLEFYRQVYKHNAGIKNLSQEELCKSAFINYGSCYTFIDWIKGGCKIPEEDIYLMGNC